MYYLKTDGGREEISSAYTRDAQMRQLEHLVAGTIDVVELTNGVVLVVAENGLNMGQPTNQQATELARQQSQELISPKHGIVGNAVLCQRDELYILYRNTVIHLPDHQKERVHK